MPVDPRFGQELAGRWPLGLASSANRPIIELVLERSRLTGCFRTTVSSEEVARGKPAPDVYLKGRWRRLRQGPRGHERLTGCRAGCWSC